MLISSVVAAVDLDGVESIEGQIVPIDTPSWAACNVRERNDAIELWIEGTVGLKAPVEIDAVEPGRYDEFDDFPSFNGDGPLLPTQQWLRIYYFRANVEGTETIRLSGSVTFSEQIVGIVGRGATLIATDGILGNPATVYDESGCIRYLDYAVVGDYDSFTLEQDLQTIRLDIEVDPASDPIRELDALRVITLASCRPDLAPPIGTLDVFDVLAFVGLLSLSSPDADWNSDGILDIYDVIGFLSDFQAGC